jgi:hypothetical protein
MIQEQSVALRCRCRGVGGLLPLEPRQFTLLEWWACADMICVVEIDKIELFEVDVFSTYTDFYVEIGDTNQCRSWLDLH